MALSSVTYSGDGSTTSFSVPFQYLFQTDVAVTISGTSSAFIWLNPGLISITPAPFSGSVVLIKRTTDVANLEVEFVDGSTVQASDINTAELQALYLAQESLDNIASAITAAASANAASAAATAAIATLTTAVNAAVVTANNAAITANNAATAANAAVANLAALVISTLTGLPTSLPGSSGQLWIDGGVIAVS